jgi:4-hydroxy-3-polyprenylbenzoate decarboxylase
VRKVIASAKQLISNGNIHRGFLQFQAFAVILPAREFTARLFWEIMPHESLGEFLAELQDNGELLRIAAQVDSALELAAIVERVGKTAKNGGPALLFENVKDSSIPVVANLLGNERRLCRSLGVASLDEVSAILERSSEAERPGGWWDPFKSSSDTIGLGRWAPKTVKTAACQQVVRLGRDLDLWTLPVPRCWPDETHPVINLGLLVTSHPATGKNVSYRSPLAVTNQQELAWYIDNADQKEIVRRAIESKQNLPVAIALGGDPVLRAANLFRLLRLFRHGHRPGPHDRGPLPAELR